MVDWLITGEYFFIFLTDRIPCNICSLLHPPVNMLVWTLICRSALLLMKCIHETLALLFRHALNQIDPCQILVDLFEGVCVESQVSCTLQGFFCHCHLFCCCLLFCDYTDGLAICLCLSPQALSLFAGLKHSFFLLPLPSFCSLHNSYEANVVCQNQDPQPDFHVTGTCLSRFRSRSWSWFQIHTIRSIQIRGQSLCGPHEF